MREIELVSEAMKSRAYILQTGEVCWSGSDIEEAVSEIAAAGHVILGFDILEPLPEGKIRLWGSSAYEMDVFLRSKAWEECVALSRALATKDLRNTRLLTGLEPPYRDLWYCVTTADRSRS